MTVLYFERSTHVVMDYICLFGLFLLFLRSLSLMIGILQLRNCRSSKQPKIRQGHRLLFNRTKPLLEVAQVANVDAKKVFSSTPDFVTCHDSSRFLGVVVCSCLVTLFFSFFRSLVFFIQ